MSKRGKHKGDHAARQRRKRRLEATCCTPAWAEAVAYHDQPLPEGLVHCGDCQRLYPPIYMTGCRCYDCVLARLPARFLAALPSSASIIRGV